jgi:hypothetical protein
MGAQSQDEATLESILKAQLNIASTIQSKLESESNLDPREYKDLIVAATGIISLAHRTEESLKTITTLQLFVDTVMEFLKSRSDTVGEDLVAALVRVAEGLNAREEVSSVIQSHNFRASAV